MTLFSNKILKMMLLKCCIQCTNKYENSAVATGQEKVSFHSNPNEIAFISHASKVMLKILQARLQQYMNQEIPDVQAEFRKENTCHFWLH